MPQTKIAIIFPSSSANRDRFNKGLELLDNIKFDIFDMQPGFESYLKGSDENRENSIIKALENPEICFLLGARGGYGASRLNREILIETLKKHPKPIVGFSDMTYLLEIWNSAQVPAFHGPVLTQFQSLDDKSLKMIINLLSGKKVNLKNEVFLINKYEKESIEGKAVGGNLTIITSGIKTASEMDFNDKILILEDINEPFYKIDRMVNQFILATDFNLLKAVVLGNFGMEQSGVESVFLSLFKKYGLAIPLFSGIQVGHGKENQVWQYNKFAQIKKTKNWIFSQEVT
jgi:muramoyltetrapeptide carboxypeptidase